MCVDDEQVVLTSLISQLNNTFGDRFEYESFQSAEEGWEFIDEMFAEGEEIDLIICDWLMPRVRGDEFLIKVHKRYPDVPMIMLSGQADENAVERAKREAKLFKFVAKPWVKEDLMEVVANALGIRIADASSSAEQPLPPPSEDPAASPKDTQEQQKGNDSDKRQPPGSPIPGFFPIKK